MNSSFNLLHSPCYCRESNDQIDAVVEELGMKSIMWNVDSSDWRHVEAGQGPGESLNIIKSGMYEVEGKTRYQSHSFRSNHPAA